MKKKPGRGNVRNDKESKVVLAILLKKYKRGLKIRNVVSINCNKSGRLKHQRVMPTKI